MEREDLNMSAMLYGMKLPTWLETLAHFKGTGKCLTLTPDDIADLHDYLKALSEAKDNAG